MDISDIAKEFSSAKLLGAGESSHGTHEFFEFKSRLFQELVTNHGFNTLLFEDSQPACEAINRFIANGEGDPDELMQQLYSVWRVEELKQLILWLRDNHANHKIEFVGFDIDQTKENIPKRDELMAKNIQKYVKSNPDTKALVWAHNSHVQVAGGNFDPKPMGSFLEKNFGSDYKTIALLFGKGTVSATKLKSYDQPGKDRTLSAISINSIPPELAEFALNKLSVEPSFFTNSQVHGSPKLVRSIGWGVVPEKVNEIIEQTDLKKSFDALIYFPTAKHSRPLPN